jgi:hypothetical protein
MQLAVWLVLDAAAEPGGLFSKLSLQQAGRETGVCVPCALKVEPCACTFAQQTLCILGRLQPGSQLEQQVVWALVSWLYFVMVCQPLEGDLLCSDHHCVARQALDLHHCGSANCAVPLCSCMFRAACSGCV